MADTPQIAASLAEWERLHEAGYFSKHISYAGEKRDDPHGLAEVLAEIKHFDRPLDAMEFGCGYGRLTAHVVASGKVRTMRLVDFPAALRESHGYLSDRLRGTVFGSVVFTDEDAARFYEAPIRETIDFAYSVTVFQHLPPEVKVAALREIVARLRIGGVAVIQFVNAAKPGTHRTHKWGGGMGAPQEPQYATTYDEVCELVRDALAHRFPFQWKVETKPSSTRPEVNWHWLTVQRN